jgi:hypothetical protein
MIFLGFTSCGYTPKLGEEFYWIHLFLLLEYISWVLLDYISIMFESLGYGGQVHPLHFTSKQILQLILFTIKRNPSRSVP